jgi:hypothetical protein
MKQVYKWEYKKRDGSSLGYVARLENSENSKEIIPHFKPLGQGQFGKGIPDEIKDCRPLYRNFSYIEQKTAYILEGEKCSQALYSAFGLYSVTSLGGSKSAKKADWSEIQGLDHYVLIPDNDQAGLDYMRDVYRILKQQNPKATFTLLNLPNLKEKDDICDWFKLHPSFKDWNELDPINDIIEKQTLEALKSDFKQFVNNNKGFIPHQWNIQAGTKGLKCIMMNDLVNMDIKPQKKLLMPWLTEQSLSMIYAGRGVGKTYFSLNCAYALATGRDFLRYDATEPVSVMYLDGEMQAPLMISRLKQIAGKDSLDAPIHFITPDLQGDRGVPDLASIEGQDEIDEMIEKVNAKVIFVDNLSTLCRTGRENEGESWIPVQNWLIKHRSQGRSVVVVDHANKEGGVRGSSRKEDVLDNVLCLKRPDDFDESKDGAKFEVHFTKARSLFGKDIKPIVASLENQDTGTWSWKFLASKQELAREYKNQGMSQVDIAKILDVNKSTVSRWLTVA